MVQFYLNDAESHNLNAIMVQPTKLFSICESHVFQGDVMEFFVLFSAVIERTENLDII